jgi:hypothetical protein
MGEGKTLSHLEQGWTFEMKVTQQLHWVKRLENEG